MHTTAGRLPEEFVKYDQLFVGSAVPPEHCLDCDFETESCKKGEDMSADELIRWLTEHPPYLCGEVCC